MQPGWEELTDEFDAVSEDGQEFHLLVYTTVFEADPPSDPAAEPPEIERICTRDGQECKRIDDVTFEIVHHGLRVTRK